MDLAHVVALLAPPACVSCRAPVGAGERLCPSCTRALPWLRRACPRCALPSHRGRPCPASGAAFLRAWAPMAYEGVARDLVAALKFRAALPVANLMAAHMAANLPAELRGPEIAGGAGGADSAVRGGDARGRVMPAAGVAVPGVAVPGGGGCGVPVSGVVGPGGGGGGVPVSGVVGPGGGGCGVSASGVVGPGGAGLPAIVPVPTVGVRRRQRGFDPAGVLAAALARRLDWPLVACLERRGRGARPGGAPPRGGPPPGGGAARGAPAPPP